MEELLQQLESLKSFSLCAFGTETFDLTNLRIHKLTAQGAKKNWYEVSFLINPTKIEDKEVKND